MSTTLGASLESHPLHRGIIGSHTFPGGVLKHGSRVILLIVGTIAVGLGVAGIFLPLLPTTPFLLLAAACYARSSPRFYSWLMNHRWFGGYIRNYRENRAMELRAKISAIVLLWLTIGVSVVLVGPFWLKIFLGLVAASVTVHLLKLRTFNS